MTELCDYCGNDHQGECDDVPALKENIDGLCVAIEQWQLDHEENCEIIEDQAAVISTLCSILEEYDVEIIIKNIDDPETAEIH